MAIRRPAKTERIVRDPRVLSGEPIIRGTRLAVRHIVLAEREFGGISGVLIAYPHLSAADVNDALAFYQANRAEIDERIRVNLAED